MEINHEEMISSLKPLLMPEEICACPVFATIKKNSTYIRNNTSEFTYATCTNKVRMLLYRFDKFSSHKEIYMLGDIIDGDVIKMQSGIYVADLTFIADVGTSRLQMSFDPNFDHVRFPKQAKNSELMYKILARCVGIGV